MTVVKSIPCVYVTQAFTGEESSGACYCPDVSQ
jgi:hypothetical protein